MAKVYEFLANGFEEIEGLAPVDILRRGGVDIKTVSITGSEWVETSHGVTLKADLRFEDVKDFGDADMLLLPGGMPGSTHLNEHEGVRQALIAHHKAGKRIGAICAAPMVLASTGILNGKKATCYPEGDSIANNRFMLDSNEFVARKPSRAKFTFGIVYNGNEYGIWVDMREGRYYVSKKIPKNTLRPIYSLSREDASVNYLAVTRASSVMQSLENMWYLGLISYESVDLKMQFADVLAMFGIR